MENKPVETEEYKKLKEKYNSTVEYYIELMEERENLFIKEKVYLEAKYLSIFGYILSKKLELEIELRRIKKKIELIQFYVSCNRKLDLQDIDTKLQKEMREFDEKLKDFKNKIEQNGQLIDNIELSSEENDEIKKIFKETARRVNPDINGNANEKQAELWSEVLKAYYENDVTELRLLANKINQSKEEIVVPSQVLKQGISMLNDKIGITLNSIENIKKEFPFNISKDLDNEQWIIIEKNTFKNTVIELEKTIRRFKAFLKAFEAEFMEV